MRISVVIPVYNASSFLHKAVNSALLQQEVTEVILVEDGSSDDSFQICQNLAVQYPNVKVLQHQKGKNRGPAASRNLGISNAQYEFVAFLDADDFYLVNRFKTAKAVFELNSDIDGVYESIGVHDYDTMSVKMYSHIEPVAPTSLFQSLQPLGPSVWFSSNGLTVKRAIFEKCGLFDETLQASEDTHMWFKMAAKATLLPGKIDEPVAMTNQNSSSLTTNHKLVEDYFIKMLYKLFEWSLKENIDDKLKELILTTLLFNIFKKQHRNKLISFIARAISLIKIFKMNINYTFFKSQSFKRYLGSLIGYNKIISIIKI
ncbi:glycosyltransferase family 2 protein [Pontibacter sp. MBLB2868]|uniref:glycosyltransferase family 2 protein n=1 Tax=Pontibacter sp. MBLB2868 TaxID=3451555 RepID=UPI003F74CD9E